MELFRNEKTENGAYPGIIQTSATAVPEGWLKFPDEFLPVFYPADKRAAGFVSIEHDDEAVTDCTWNEEAYQSWLAKQPDPLDARRPEKEAELSAACNSAIVAGMDVETTQGTEHFSLEETDQINLSTALSAVQTGAANYPYHADGKLCRMFTAAEIQSIAQASIQHKLYHTTLCNHLLTWARRAETEEELKNITYTAEGLPDDLAQNMAQVLEAAQNV